MTKESIVAILLSLSPFGEAKVGIPYGMLNGVNIYIVFITCFLANVLVFPLMMFFLEKIFKIEKKRGFVANLTGIFFSSVIVWLTTYFSMGS